MIKNISFKFNLFDASNKPINEMPVNIQYFNMQENQWISIYNDVIKKGLLSIDEKATSRAKALKLFLDKIKSFEIPELRIVPEKQIFDLKKQEVLSITYEFEILNDEGFINFDFGSAWLLDKEVLTQNDRYKTFFWITTPFSFVNQKENLAKNSELEQNLNVCKEQNTKLVQENKTITSNLQNLSKRFETLTTENQSNLALVKERATQVEKLNKDLLACNKANEKLQKSYDTINTDFEDYKKTCTALKTEWEQKLKELQGELSSNKQTIDELQSNIKECQASKIALEKKYNAEISRLEEANKLKQGAYIALENLYNELNKNYQNKTNCEEYAQQLTQSQNDLKKCQENYRNIESALENCTGQKSELNNENEKLIQEKIALDKHISNQNNEILSLQNNIEELSKEIVIEDRPVAVKNIYKNLVQELDIASELSKSNNYSLSNLSIKLKGVINQDANNNIGIQLFSKENAHQINGNTISDLSFDIIPTPRQNVEPGKVPDVLGLTETAVTRILESVGLKLNPVYQKSENPNGASFKQTPQKDTPINPNEFVTVIFSKNE